MTYRTTLAIIGMTLIAHAGCVLDEASVGEEGFYITECDPDECGTGNTGFVNGHPLTELEQSGKLGAEKFRIVGYTDELGSPRTVRAVNSQFYIKYTFSPTGGTVWKPLGVYDDELHIKLEYDEGDPMTVEHHVLQVRMPMGPLKSWADPTVVIPSYVINYWDPQLDRFAPFCVPVDNPANMITTAVLVVKDRFDEPSKSVWNDATTASYFNVACEGGAIFKNKRLGYDPELVVHGTPTQDFERQATLKMMVADYCGTGTSYTVYNTPLAWQNDHGWFSVPPGAQLEAVWGPGGALCLGEEVRHPEFFYEGPGDTNPACDIPRCIEGSLPVGIWTTYLP